MRKDAYSDHCKEVSGISVMLNSIRKLPQSLLLFCSDADHQNIQCVVTDAGPLCK